MVYPECRSAFAPGRQGVLERITAAHGGRQQVIGCSLGLQNQADQFVPVGFHPGALLGCQDIGRRGQPSIGLYCQVNAAGLQFFKDGVGSHQNTSLCSVNSPEGSAEGCEGSMLWKRALFALFVLPSAG